jgi:hypothetical protein
MIHSAGKLQYAKQKRQVSLSSLPKGGIGVHARSGWFLSTDVVYLVFWMHILEHSLALWLCFSEEGMLFLSIFCLLHNKWYPSVL